MTKERAKTIIQNAQSRAQENNTSWEDQVDYFMNFEEARELCRFWLSTNFQHISDVLIYISKR